MAFPAAQDEAGWNALCKDEAALAPGVAAVLARHGLAHERATRFDSGSLPVYAVGERHVLKLFPPHERDHWSVESRVLAAVENRLPIPTPRLVAADTLDGWPYVVMSRLRGERLVDAWPSLDQHRRDGVADTLGEALAALHAIDIAPLADLRPRWSEFIAAQHASAAQRQAARGLAPRWVEQVPGFLQRWAPTPAPRLALLHTEVMREHLTVSPDGRLSGLFDFEPAMVGAPEYEFSSVGLFVACGDGRALRRILRAYGVAGHKLDEALQCRLMACTLLHRYSNLRWYLERLPPPEGAATLERLAAHWWPLASAATPPP